MESPPSSLLINFNVDPVDCPWPALALYVRWREDPAQYDDLVKANIRDEMGKLGDAPWKSSGCRLVAAEEGEEGAQVLLLGCVAFWDFLGAIYGEKTLGIISKDLANAEQTPTITLFDALSRTVMVPAPKIISRWVHYVLTLGTSFYKATLLGERFADVLLPFFDQQRRWSFATRPSILDASVSANTGEYMHFDDTGDCVRYAYAVDNDARLSLGGFEVFDMTAPPLNACRLMWRDAGAAREFKAVVFACYNDGSFEVLNGICSPAEVPFDRRDRLHRLMLVVYRTEPCSVVDTAECMLDVFVPLAAGQATEQPSEGEPTTQ